jgi:hypothetical protein
MMYEAPTRRYHSPEEMLLKKLLPRVDELAKTVEAHDLVLRFFILWFVGQLLICITWVGFKLVGWALLP